MGSKPSRDLLEEPEPQRAWYDVTVALGIGMLLPPAITPSGSPHITWRMVNSTSLSAKRKKNFFLEGHMHATLWTRIAAGTT